MVSGESSALVDFWGIILGCVSEVVHAVVPGSPWVDWDDFGRPRHHHVCSGLGAVAVLLGREDPEEWHFDIVNNSVFPAIHCSACGLSGFWIFGEWKERR